MGRAVRSYTLAGVSFAAIAIAGCASFTYNHDFDPAVDFSKYKTYVWIEVADPATPHPRGMNELIEKRIAATIDETLASKGYTKRQEGPADFVVNFIGTTQQKVDFNTYYTGWGYYGWHGGTQVEAYQYTEGTLIIDILDASTKGLSWRGTVSGTLEPTATPEQRNARIATAVAGIFQRFPPGPPGS